MKQIKQPVSIYQEIDKLNKNFAELNSKYKLQLLAINVAAQDYNNAENLADQYEMISDEWEKALAQNYEDEEDDAIESEYDAKRDLINRFNNLIPQIEKFLTRHHIYIDKVVYK